MLAPAKAPPDKWWGFEFRRIPDMAMQSSARDAPSAGVVNGSVSNCVDSSTFSRCHRVFETLSSASLAAAHAFFGVAVVRRLYAGRCMDDGMCAHATFCTSWGLLFAVVGEETVRRACAVQGCQQAVKPEILFFWVARPSLVVGLWMENCGGTTGAEILGEVEVKIQEWP